MRLEDLDDLLPEMYTESPITRLEPRVVYDPAIIGVAEKDCGNGPEPFLVYNQDLLLELATAAAAENDPEDEDPRQTAVDHFDYNIVPSAVGPGAPAFIRLLD